MSIKKPVTHVEGDCITDYDYQCWGTWTGGTAGTFTDPDDPGSGGNF